MRGAIGLLVVALTLVPACDDGPDDSTTDDATTDGDTGESTTTGGSTTSTTGEMCEQDSDCNSGQVCQNGTCVTDPGEFWVVGGDGAILNVKPQHSVSPHPTTLTSDLAAITCYGNKRAWYVGTAGAAGYTEDGGLSWIPLALETAANLRDVASTDPLRVAIVGEGGTLLQSTDGIQFDPIFGAQGVLTGVDLTPSGLVAVAEDGQIWVHEANSEGAQVVVDTGASLRAVDFGDHTPIGVAVGDGGTLLWSQDGGYTWEPRVSHTQVDLLAVQVSSTGDQAIAVGAEGVVVRIAGPSVMAFEVDTVDLHAIHLDAWGRGAVVGAAGHVLHTEDAGRTFTPETVTDVALYGVDALGERHW